MLYFDSGDLDRAKDFLEQALRVAQQHQEELFMEAPSRIGLGRTLAKIDPWSEEAEIQIRRGIRMAEERGVKPHVANGYHFLGELLAARGEREMARESLGKAVAIYEKIGQEAGVDSWLTQAQAALRKLVEEEK
jgi:tetratricopeptide (TPR) repeat protein